MAKETTKHSKIGSTDMSRRISVFKVVLVILLIILQIGVTFAFYTWISAYTIYLKVLALFLTFLAVIYIINKRDNPAYKLIWVVLILAAPLVGGLLYIFFAGNRTRLKFIEEALENHLDTFRYMPSDKENQKEIKELSKSASVQSTYISKAAGYPVYKNTSVKYFPLGEDNFKTLVEELNKAKHYIFMEYFIIKQGKMWDTVLEVLTRKAKEGVDVRLIYDDVGCAMWMPSRFIAEMTASGIKVAPFNPISPVVSLRQNNRDHRKITIIDGHTGFTGGINLADENINIGSKFGHWKDTGIMLKGEAVWNLTLMFLQTWRMLTKQEDNYSLYTPMRHKKTPVYSDGYVQPYGDTPVDSEIVGENIYLNMINKAKYYVYITTPYLIIDNEMVTALTLAAKSGIDVRIITQAFQTKRLYIWLLSLTIRNWLVLV